MPSDAQDYLTVLGAIFRQAIDDYIKLQHPRYRHKIYLQEAFDDAVDMLFDKHYRFLYLKNEEGEDMSLRDMLANLLSNKNTDVNKLKNYAIEESIKFWETKLIRTIYIPSTIIIDGHVYRVEHTDSPDWEIDFKEKIVRTDKTEDQEHEARFIEAITAVMAYHADIKIKQDDLEALGKTLFRTLKMNTCFTGDYMSNLPTARNSSAGSS